MLNKLRSLTYKYAVISSVLIALAFYVIYDGVGHIFALMPDSLVRDYMYQITAMLYPVGIALIFGFASSYKSEKFFKGLRVGLFLLIFELIILLAQLLNSTMNESLTWKPWYLIIYGVVMVVGIAVREEAIFRVTIQNILAKRYASSVGGVWFVAIISAVIFGLIHAFNIFVGVDPVSALIQALVNVCVGMLFSAIYLRCANVWVLMLLHAVTDTAGLFNSLFFTNVTIADDMSGITWQTFILAAVMLAIAAFLLRPSKCREILEQSQNR